MDLVSSLIDQYFDCPDGELLVGAVPIGRIANEFGTPLFVYDAAALRRKWGWLRAALPANFEVSYSVKANPAKRVLEFFLSLGCGLEIASKGELLRALTAGCPPSKIIFAGPGKTEAELEIALAHQIAELHVESVLEIQRIAQICGRLGQRARIALRVNPCGQSQGGAMRMGGKPAPFGIDEERLDEVVDQILAAPRLDLQGVHLFIGTQILDASILIGQYHRALDIAVRMASRVGHTLHTVDFGGGLGIPYFPGESRLDLQEFGKGLAHLSERAKREPLLSGTRFMIEPGRFLVGEGGIYLTRINDIKTSRGKKFLILDGGMNHHLAASGNLGQVIKKNFPVALLTRLTQAQEETVDLVGPLCTPLDTLGRDVKLPIARVGDLLGIFQSGAYARSASPVDFLSHPTPAEVWVENGRATLIQPRGQVG